MSCSAAGATSPRRWRWPLDAAHPIVLTEADSHLGLANRALAPLARRVCLAFPIPGETASATA